MQKFKIKFQPKSKLFINVFIFETLKEMRDFCGHVLEDKSSDYSALCDRNKKNNRVAELFFNREELSENIIIHELLHVIFGYIRNKDFREVLKYVFDAAGHEEELCSTLTFLKVQIEEKIGWASKTDLYCEKLAFNDGKKAYNWP